MLDFVCWKRSVQFSSILLASWNVSGLFNPKICRQLRAPPTPLYAASSTRAVSSTPLCAPLCAGYSTPERTSPVSSASVGYTASCSVKYSTHYPLGRMERPRLPLWLALAQYIAIFSQCNFHKLEVTPLGQHLVFDPHSSFPHTNKRRNQGLS